MTHTAYALHVRDAVGIVQALRKLADAVNDPQQTRMVDGVTEVTLKPEVVDEVLEAFNSELGRQVLAALEWGGQPDA